MSREKQIEEMAEHLIDIQQDFNEYCAKPCRECELGGIVNCENHYKAKALYNAGYRKQEWISVDERLPEEAGRAYLVWDNVQATVKKRFFNRIPLNMPVETYPYIREYFGNVSDYKRYTHWMPLPEPPKMKGGAE